MWFISGWFQVDWTPELHKKFVQAVEKLGVDQVIPSHILELMKVDGWTRHNVVSHLQVKRNFVFLYIIRLFWFDLLALFVLGLVWGLTRTKLKNIHFYSDEKHLTLNETGP